MERFFCIVSVSPAMGTKIGDLVPRRTITLEEIEGWIIAFDAYNVLYQFLASIRTPEGFPLTGKDGRVVSHLKGLLSRTSNLMYKGIRPVFVFDGIPHDLKAGVLAQRRERKEKAYTQWQVALEAGDMETARTKAQQTSRLTPEMVSDAKNLLDLMGIPVVQAPGEGEAQASYMASSGMVDAVASQDMDSLLFGARTLIRNLGLSAKRKLPGRRQYVETNPEIIILDETLISLGIDRSQLVDISILVGTDFNEGVKGIGPKRALTLIKEFKTLPEAAKAGRIPLLEWDEVRRIFLEPEVDHDPEFEWRKPDEEGLLSFLSEELCFGADGIRKAVGDMTSYKQIVPQMSLDNF